MALARFLPVVPIEAVDGEMMLEVLVDLYRRASRRWPPTVRALVHRLLREVEAAVSGRSQPCGGASAVFVGKEALLDLAADLLDASGMLHRAGSHLEAMALEGLEARLLEALVGAGAVELAG